MPKIPFTVVLVFVGYIDLPNLNNHLNLNYTKNNFMKKQIITVIGLTTLLVNQSYGQFSATPGLLPTAQSIGANVGIGTGSPNAKLEILGTANQFRLSNTSSIFNDINTNASGYLTIMPSNATTSRIGFNTIAPSTGFHSNMGTFLISDPSNTTRSFQIIPSRTVNGDIPAGTTLVANNFVTGEGLSIAAGGTGTAGVKLGAYAFNGSGWKSAWETANTSGGVMPNLLLVKSGGNVGIGTSSPLFSAHINGDLFVTGSGGNAPGNPGIAGGATMYLGDNNTQPQWGIEYNDPNITTGSIAGGMNFWRPAGSTGIGGNYVLFLKNDSKVGIHTNNPTADLTVNGNMLIGDPSVSLPTGYKLYVQTGILTEKVKVALTTTTDWADYVFAKDYKLKSLTEVNSFINSNKHLPGVPSASELVEQGGFDLGKMDAKLLEKIEELTLYLIQLDKTNKELTERLLKLESSK